MVHPTFYRRLGDPVDGSFARYPRQLGASFITGIQIPAEFAVPSTSSHFLLETTFSFSAEPHLSLQHRAYSPFHQTPFSGLSGEAEGGKMLQHNVTLTAFGDL